MGAALQAADKKGLFLLVQPLDRMLWYFKFRADGRNEVSNPKRIEKSWDLAATQATVTVIKRGLEKDGLGWRRAFLRTPRLPIRRPSGCGSDRTWCRDGKRKRDCIGSHF
jgi:hypothetical protein